MISVLLAGIVLASPAVLQKDVYNLLPVTLRDVAGTPVQIPMPGKKATVILFLAVDCPIGNRYAPEIARIGETYSAKGIGFLRAYPDPDVSVAAVKKHGTDFHLAGVAILDPKGALTKAVGATVTPEVALIGADGKLLYRGRIDDWNVQHGRVKANYRKDLRIALDEFLAGKPVSMPRTAAVGCFISPGS